MSRKTIEDLLITLSFLKLAIIMTTIVVVILIMVDGTNTETFLSHYKKAYLAINFKKLAVNAPLFMYMEFIWRYIAELVIVALTLAVLLNYKWKCYFIFLLLSMGLAFSIKIDLVIISGIEIVLSIIYFSKKKIS